MSGEKQVAPTPLTPQSAATLISNIASADRGFSPAELALLREAMDRVQEIQRTTPAYLTVEQAARLISYSASTLYHWICDGKLNAARGLRRNGRTVRIEWLLFKAAFDRGEFE